MNKKLLFIGAIFILVVILVILASRQSSPAQTTAPSVRPTLAAPAPTTIFTQPSNVTFSFAASPTIPTSLPSYTVQPMPLSSIEQIAEQSTAALALGATPSALTRGDSYTETWSRPNEAALTITKTNNLTTLSFRQIKSKRPPNVLAPGAAAQQFLALLVPPTEGLVVRVTGTTNGPFNGLLVLDSPAPTSFTNYYYSYFLDDYPILTTGLSISPASVIADDGGVVRFASVVPPPSSLQIGTPVALLTVNQVLASLMAGRGTLLDTHNPETPDQGVVPNFSKFIIEDAKVVYAPKEAQLLPALYMTGTGTATGGATQKATIFLWLTVGSP